MAEPTTGLPRLRRLPGQLLNLPVREARFWIVQAGVVTLAVLHDVVLVATHTHDLAGVPAPTTSALLLVPVIYAALNFGVRGAVGTSVWATVLIVPHWFVAHDLTVVHVSIEAVYLFVLNAVAVVVGLRVEREQRARQRAESALGAARAAEARYYTLFEEQPSPVIITDRFGVVVEANGAATRLLGTAAVGRDLTTLLGVDGHGPITGARPLSVTTPDGDEVLLVPTVRRLEAEDGSQLDQVVLSDVTEQHRRQEEQRLFALRLLNVQEDERHSLARELHDAPLQDLTYLARTLEDLGQSPCEQDRLAERLLRGAAVAEGAAVALRKVIRGLRPPVLDDLGLVSALRQLAEETQARTDVRVSFRTTGTQVRLGPELELAAYRIAQEALANVVRHAHAASVTIRLSFADDLVTLSVADDGIGMLPAGSAQPGDLGLGLLGMRERVNMAGGTLEVSARRPHGTRVRATLPVRKTDPELVR